MQIILAIKKLRQERRDKLHKRVRITKQIRSLTIYSFSMSLCAEDFDGEGRYLVIRGGSVVEQMAVVLE